MAHRLKVYIAGPESFLINGAQIACQKEKLCSSHELECLRVDGSSGDASPEGLDFGMRYANSVALMLRADVGVFNLTPIGRSTPEAGTVFSPLPPDSWQILR